MWAYIWLHFPSLYVFVCMGHTPASLCCTWRACGGYGTTWTFLSSIPFPPPHAISLLIVSFSFFLLYFLFLLFLSHLPPFPSPLLSETDSQYDSHDGLEPVQSRGPLTWSPEFLVLLCSAIKCSWCSWLRMLVFWVMLIILGTSHLNISISGLPWWSVGWLV